MRFRPARFGVWLLASLVTPSTEAAERLLPIAVVGLPNAPGEFYGTTTTPSINRTGEVAFGSGLVDTIDPLPPLAVAVALFTGPSDAPVERLRTGDAIADGVWDDLAPGFRGTPFNDAGDFLFVSAVEPVGDPDARRTSLWKHSAWGVSEVLRFGTPVGSLPGDSDVFELRWIDAGDARLNAAGEVVVAASAARIGNSNVVPSQRDTFWTSRNDQPATLRAVEAPIGSLFGEGDVPTVFNSGSVVLNDAGVTAFNTQAPTTDGGSAPIDLVIDDRQGQTLQGLAEAPIADSTLARGARIDVEGINNRGTMVAGIQLEDQTTGLAIVEDGRIEPFLLTGDPLPGLPSNFGFTFSYEAVINRNGEVAFFGIAQDANTFDSLSGVWVGPPDDLTPVALEGASAPGTEGRTFQQLIRSEPSINVRGQVVFFAGLDGGSINSGIWATDVDGGLHKIVDRDDVIEVTPGDSRTVSFLRMATGAGGEDGAPRPINDAGQIVFQASFTDGTSGVFLSEAVASVEGDFDGDGEVSQADYSVWQAGYGRTDAAGSLAADANGDGVVNAADYTLWRDQVGWRLFTPPSETAAVPEPQTLAAVTLALLARLSVARRRD